MLEIKSTITEMIMPLMSPLAGWMQPKKKKKGLVSLRNVKISTQIPQTEIQREKSQ